MIQVRCPTCKKAFEVEKISDRPGFPFCSERCRLIDLGRWIDGVHAIPGDPVMPGPSPGLEDEDD